MSDATTHTQLRPVDDRQRGHRFSELEQYVTPEWFAEALVNGFFGDLNEGDRVVDVGAGAGAFLKAVPDHIPAVGIEIDPVMASYAEHNSGRSVLVGDFRTLELPFQPTAFLGNPPFRRATVDALLKRMHALLPDGGRGGLLLPAYHFQWARPTLEWGNLFSMEQHMIPREVFPGLLKPLNFVLFRKERVRRMWGFFLYPEVAEVAGLSKEAKLILTHGRPRKGAWRSVVDAALAAAGGKATLADIYRFVEGRRPFPNPKWKEQIRKVLQISSGYNRVGDGVYALAA